MLALLWTAGLFQTNAATNATIAITEGSSVCTSITAYTFAGITSDTTADTEISNAGWVWDCDILDTAGISANLTTDFVDGSVGQVIIPTMLDITAVETTSLGTLTLASGSNVTIGNTGSPVNFVSNSIPTNAAGTSTVEITIPAYVDAGTYVATLNIS